ncbi:MAG TPA: hypothetical protein VJ876_01735 [Bacteroidales bacterium]|nr:hypothetical protein [Bacteroidales bacterium]
MKKILFIFLLFLIIRPASSQPNIKSFNFGFEMGWGTYSMNELKELNTVVLNNLPFPAKIVSDFPPYYYYKPMFVFEFNHSEFGAFITRQSSGSRISSRDYSGEYRFEIRTYAKSFGIHYLIKLNPGDLFEIGLYSDLGQYTSRLKVQESLELFSEESLNEEYTFRTNSFFLEPGFSISCQFRPVILQLTAGYNYEFSKKGLSANTIEMINIHSGKRAKISWDGFRAGASLYFCVSAK